MPVLFPRTLGSSLSFYFLMRHSHAKEANPLRAAGLKSTPGRRAVLQTLAKAVSPLSPEQIHAKVGSEVCDRARSTAFWNPWGKRVSSSGSFSTGKLYIFPRSPTTITTTSSAGNATPPSSLNIQDH